VEYNIAMEVRIDKWMWAVRIFKTRNLANMACKKGKIRINGIEARSSKTVKIDDRITVSFPGIDRTYRVLSPIEKRVGAKLAPEAVREETDPAEIERYEKIRRDPLSAIFAARPRGSGRPSKKERREMNRFRDSSTDEEDEEEEDILPS